MVLGVDPRRFGVLERFRPRLGGGSEHRARTRDEEVGEDARGHIYMMRVCVFVCLRPSVVDRSSRSLSLSLSLSAVVWSNAR